MKLNWKVVATIGTTLAMLTPALTTADAATTGSISNMRVMTVHKSTPSIPGLTINNMATSASSVHLNASSNSNLHISSISINATTVSIKGTESQGGNSTPFDLQGSLFRSPISGRIFGNLKDSTGHFQVVRFEFAQNAKKDLFINKSISGPGLAIYLKKLGTRDFSFFESPLDKYVSSSQVRQLFTEFNQFPKNNSYSAASWMAKLFKPKVTVKTKTVVGNPVSLNSLRQSASANPLSSGGSATPIDEYQTYYDTFSNGSLGTIQDSCELEGIVTEPTQLGSGTPIPAQLNFISKDYYEEAQNYNNHNIDSWEIGGDNGKVGLYASIPYPDYPTSVVMRGNGWKGGQPTLSWGISQSVGPFSGTFTYTNSQPATFGGEQRTNPTTDPTLEIYSNNGVYLNAPGQYFAWTFDGAHITGASSGSSKINLSIGYNVINTADPSGGLNGEVVDANAHMDYPWTATD